MLKQKCWEQHVGGLSSLSNRKERDYNPRTKGNQLSPAGRNWKSTVQPVKPEIRKSWKQEDGVIVMAFVGLKTSRCVTTKVYGRRILYKVIGSQRSHLFDRCIRNRLRRWAVLRISSKRIDWYRQDDWRIPWITFFIGVNSVPGASWGRVSKGRLAWKVGEWWKGSPYCLTCLDGIE